MRQNNQAHWDKVYTRNTDQQVGWYQPRPVTSLRLIQQFIPERQTPLIDIGAGNSHLAADLVALGYQDLTVLDISGAALDRARGRLGEHVSKVTLIKGSVLDFTTEKKFGLWHDRAVFHFFHETNEQESYKANLLKYLEPRGIFILGTFSMNGPEICSGLPVNRQSPESIEKLFGDAFGLVESFTEDHFTPGGKVQNYLFSVLRRKV